MPRASWRGFLRLSLVACPISLSSATTRTKSIRLHQVWRPASVDEGEDDFPDRGPGQQVSGPSRPRLVTDDAGPDADHSAAATRITLRPHDPGTGEEVEKAEVVKGYEYSRGQFVTFTPQELKALDVESSKVIDLEKFVPVGEIDPVYFDSPYYVYPDGPIAIQTLQVIGAAIAEVGVVGLGRLTLSRRERIVMVEPRGTGMALFTLRSVSEVRAPGFGGAEGDLDAEMVAIAGAIIRQRIGHFDPSTYRDRYQDALQQLIEKKMKGLTIEPEAASTPPTVIDLMTALKRSLTQDTPITKRAVTKRKSSKTTPDRRQAALLLPLSGGRKRKAEAASKPSATAPKRRRKA
jgi:DNA end-binding protein Ku